MPEKKSSFIRVDELLPQIGLEQAAAFYGAELPELKRIGQETRTRCFLACGRSGETGERALAIQTDSPTKIWKCHEYGCTRGGNLVSLCDLMKPGQSTCGRPRGERFKELARDLKAMVEGEPRLADEKSAPAKAPSAPPVPVNIPLAESDNERARALVTLDEEFVTDPAQMPPEAAGYFRRRRFLTAEACQEFRVGYLPQSSKSLLRGKIVYPYFSAEGKLLTWFGRDPRYEDKLRKWAASDRSEPEPTKTQFVKGFHRGLELWGEHLLRAKEAPRPQAELGLVIVEGPNDAINLQLLGIPAVALCSNTITREQAERVAALAGHLETRLALLMLDCDEEGEHGVAQMLPLLARHLHVRLGWHRGLREGAFRDRQPEQLTRNQWSELVDGMKSPCP